MYVSRTYNTWLGGKKKEKKRQAFRIPCHTRDTQAITHGGEKEIH